MTTLMGRLGRLFCWAVMLGVACAWVVVEARAAGPQVTSVRDIVYRADGRAASGWVVISWNAFVTADGAAVAAGTKSVQLGADGTLSVTLAPNAGATPSGSFYSVTMKLDGGPSSKEAWVVPADSPVTLAKVRATEIPATMAVQSLTEDWAIANLVSVAGAQTVTGAKSFSVSPSVPDPVKATDAATKAYVDANSVAGPNTAKTNVQNTWSQAQWFSSGPMIDAKAWGARGDNVTDDAAALQGAFAFAYANGGCLHVPAGRYLVSATLTWTITAQNSPAPCIFGDGMFKSVLVPYGALKLAPGSGAAWNASLVSGAVSPGAPVLGGTGYTVDTDIIVTGITCSVAYPTYSPQIVNGTIAHLYTNTGTADANSGAGCTGTPVLTAVSRNAVILMQSGTTVNRTMYGANIHDLGIQSADGMALSATDGIVMNGVRHAKIEMNDIEYMTNAISVPLDYYTSGNTDQHQSDKLRVALNILNHNKGYGLACQNNLGCGNLTVDSNMVQWNSVGGILASTSFIDVQHNSIHMNGCNSTGAPGNGKPGSVTCDGAMGGGLIMPRIAAGAYGCFIQNNEFDGNFTYHIWQQSVQGCDISRNRFISHIPANWNDGFQHPQVHVILGGFGFPNPITSTPYHKLARNGHRSDTAPYNDAVIWYMIPQLDSTFDEVEDPINISNSSVIAHYATGGGVMAYATVSGGKVLGDPTIVFGGWGYVAANVPAFNIANTANCAVAPTFNAPTLVSGAIASVTTATAGSGCTDGTYVLIASPVAMTDKECMLRSFTATEGATVKCSTHEPAIHTAGWGGVWLPYVTLPGQNSGAVMVSASNQVRYCRVVIPYQVTAGNIRAEVVAKSASGGQHADFGLYSLDGTSRIFSTGGGVDVSSGNGAMQVPIASGPVVINAGVYLFAWTSQDATVTFRLGGAAIPDALMNVLTNKDSGVAGNAAVNGALPSALGAMTGASAQVPPLVYVEP